MKRKLLGSLALVMTLGVIGVTSFNLSNNKSDIAYAAENERWSITGAFADSFNWNKDVYLSYNATTKYYEGNLYLQSGNTFKVRKDGKWDISHGYGTEEIVGSEYESLVSDSGGNFKINSTGLYKMLYDSTNNKFGMKKLSTNKNSDKEDSNEKWYLRGSFAAGNDWSNGVLLEYDSLRDRYSTVVEVKNNDEFKIVYNDNWDCNEIGYANTETNGCGTTWTGTDVGGNIKFNVTGKVVVYVNDDLVQQYGTNTYGFGVENYNASYVAADIKTLAGGWNNNVSTANCATNYATAKEMILVLSAEELNTFKTSTNTEIASAKKTYEHWCDVNNDANPYSGGVVSGANIALNFVNDNSIYLIVILTIVSVSFVGFILLKKKKQANY